MLSSKEEVESDTEQLLRDTDEKELSAIPTHLQLNDASKDELYHMTVVHDQVLKETNQLFDKIFVIALFLVFNYAMRGSLIVLYASTFTSNFELIGFIIYLSYIAGALQGMIYGIIGDQWRYDHLLLVALVLDVVTYFITASTNSIELLAIFEICGTQPSQIIYEAWLGKLLPANNTRQHLTTFVQYNVIGYMLGPITGGIIAHYATYRNAFYVSAAVSCVLLVYGVIYFRNVEGKLVEKQSELKEYYASSIISDVNKQLKSIRKASGSVSNNDSGISNTNTNANTKSRSRNADIILGKMLESLDASGSLDVRWIHSKRDRFPIASSGSGSGGVERSKKYHRRTSKENWVLIILGLLQATLVSSNEVIMLIYYTSYLKDKFNSNIFLSTAQLSELCVFVIVSAQFVIYFVKKRTKENRNSEIAKYGFDNVLVRCCFISLILSIFNVFVLFPLNLFDYGEDNYIITYWFYIAISGTCFGILSNSQAMLLLEIIPPKMAGQIGAFQISLKLVFGASFILTLSFLWQYSYDWFWYLQGVLYCISLLLLIMAVACDTLITRRALRNH